MTVLISHLSFSNLHIFKVPIFIFFNLQIYFFNFNVRVSTFQVFRFSNSQMSKAWYADLPTFSELQILRYGKIIYSKMFPIFLYFSKTVAPSKLPKCRKAACSPYLPK